MFRCALQAHADGPTTFGVQSRFRAKAREAFVRWDCGERVRRAALRKAAPVVGSYQVGDIVSYCREARAGEHGLQKSVGSRLIGFDKDKNRLCETLPRTCWVICDFLSLCVAIDRLRPCTPAELLALHHTQTKSSSPLAVDVQTQQGFIDERAALHSPKVADPLRTADEDLDEDKRDDEMSEPTQMTRADIERLMKLLESFGRRCLKLLRHIRVHYDLMMKHMNSLYALRNKPEPQRRELKRFKMCLFCSKRSIANIRGMDFFK